MLCWFFSIQKRAAIPLITDKDITGFAPVHYAAKYGNLEVSYSRQKVLICVILLTSEALH